jgi:NAD(P)-dependent dehydrogenase (short-subunit alcohol dehydrogenase family)
METTAGAIVTGGSQGIGFAIAEALLKRGMRVAITGRDPGRLDAAAQRLAAGDRVVRLAADVGDAKAARALVDQATAALGGLDVLVNNAGVGLFGNVSDFSVEDWDRVVATNVSGVFYCTRAAIPHLRRRGEG